MVRYLKDSIDNMRDIGGYKTGQGNRVKMERIIRSNLPINLSSNDISLLDKMGMNTVIDLRSQEEIENRKSSFENNKNFKVYHIGIDVGKDRTGVVTVLILKLLNVSENDIIEDYVSTRQFMKTTLIKFANSNNRILNIITPKEIYMQEFLKEFEKNITI